RLESPLRRPERDLRFVPVLDVERRPEPANDPAAVVAHWRRAGEMPPILAMRVANAVFDLGRFRCLDGTRPPSHKLVSIVRVYRDEGALVAKCVFFTQAGEVEPAIVDPFELAVGVARPDDLRQSIGQRTIRHVATIV